MVVEKYSAVRSCNRCGEPGFLNHSCQVCLVGTYNVQLTKESKMGKCTACNTIGKLGYCCSCTDESSDGFAEQPCFEEADLDSVHLDTMGDHFTDDEDYIVDIDETVLPTLMKPQDTAATYGPYLDSSGISVPHSTRVPTS
jgi:hypothetical protein